MPDLAYINRDKKIVPLEEATISVLDRGFLFADSVYEVIRVYRKTPFYLLDHLKRLDQNLKALEILFPELELIPALIEQMISNSGYSEAKIYIQVTRGISKRQLSFSRLKPTLVIFIEQLNTDQIEEWQCDGIKLITVPDTRGPRCHLKTTGLLSNVLAHHMAQKTDAYDALFVDPNGMIRETTHASFFFILNGNLIVPPANDYLLPGITRNIVLHLVDKLNIPISIRQPKLTEVYDAQEAFITATTTEIIPVKQIDHMVFAGFQSQNSARGPITEKLFYSYCEYVTKWIDDTL